MLVNYSMNFNDIHSFEMNEVVWICLLTIYELIIFLFMLSIWIR